ELQRGGGCLRGRRVGDEPAVDVAHADGADRAVERDARQAECGRGAVHGQDVWIVLLITGDRETDDLNLVPESVGKQRPDGPVDETRGEDLFLDRRAFSLEVAAGDPPAGIRALAILHGEREEVL